MSTGDILLGGNPAMASILSRRGSTPVSIVLRKSVRFFITNIFLIINRTFQVEIWKMVCTNVFFSNFRALDAPSMNQKPGKENFRELESKKLPRAAWPRAPLEACSLGPLFRNLVSIYSRFAPAVQGGVAIFLGTLHAKEEGISSGAFGPLTCLYPYLLLYL